MLGTQLLMAESSTPPAHWARKVHLHCPLGMPRQVACRLSEEALCDVAVWDNRSHDHLGGRPLELTQPLTGAVFLLGSHIGLAATQSSLWGPDQGRWGCAELALTRVLTGETASPFLVTQKIKDRQKKRSRNKQARPVWYYGLYWSPGPRYQLHE